MSRQKFLPGIEPLHLPEARQAIPHVHAYLRDRILDGTIAPGTKLSQVTLAAQLGISRTPVREVLRMLQDEGLVEIEPNQRTRVSELDPNELDQIYASRILLETLAVSMSLGDWCTAARVEANRLLKVMKRAARASDFDTWFEAHSQFHRLITVRAGEAFQRQLQVWADQTIRYIRIYQLAEPSSWQTTGQREHEQIIKALIAGDEKGALTGMAQHLARTALRVLNDCAPDFEPIAVPRALALIEDRFVMEDPLTA